MAPRKPKAALFINQLLEAVKHVSAVQNGKGDDPTIHCQVRYGQIIAYSRSLAAGAPIVELDLDCCPQTEKLRLALERCGSEHSITQQADSLFVRSGDFSAYVPLCDPAKLSVPVPDPACAPLGDTFRSAVQACGTLLKENAATVLQSCIQLNAWSCVSTNGNVILEAWHGFDFPPLGMLISKAFADVIVKSNKKIVSFGFSSPTMPGPPTFTVHFEDRSWYRTNLETAKIPDILKKLTAATYHALIPIDFFKQVAEIGKWSADGRVYFRNATMTSHPPQVERTGSVLSYDLVGLHLEGSYSVASLKLISKYATHFDTAGTMFFGNNLRGAIAHEQINEGYCGEVSGVCEGKCEGTCLQMWRESQPKCPRCQCDMKGGICQNYGCETPRDPRNSGPISDEDIPF